MVSRNDLLPGTVISSSRIFRAVSLGTCFRITSRTRSTVLLLAATRHLLQHPQGHRPFTLAVTGRASRPNRVRNGLPAGGRWIRTCMGLFLSSGLLVCWRFFVRSAKVVLRPVACDQVRGAGGRGQGTGTVA